ncbi:hypothetical protein CGH72_08655 [Vibrio parahaemolyticus]|nr:hypothetical protein BTZ05_21825 [Vibrio parahaemolyticus]TOJ76945.1 hypothetical protein CGI32_24275 [Vibrio parahaemolyticus]TOM56289.1 hypothetical protein CGH75_16440 [Vibrio parahaemolyticus]TOM64726.1 hypothetical protein CGH73_21085 [Vibrio parahaemolyticus]TOM73436.1 hypothetical protein CGH72_08655 [Vibrio parahaemolyticus]
MPAFTIVYKSKNNEQLLKETIFMKNLGAAKRSAISQAPVITHNVKIYDLMERCLSVKTIGSKWEDQPK